MAVFNSVLDLVGNTPVVDVSQVSPNPNVKILAKVGTESVFVSGRFNEGDEVIVSSSRELADGTPLRALAAGSSASGGGSGRSGPPGTAPVSPR